MPDREYGGTEAVDLCYNDLEFNSRLILSWVNLMALDVANDNFSILQNKYPSQWIHYICIQSGLDNLEQARFEFHDAINWLHNVKMRNTDNPNIKKAIVGILQDAKQLISTME
jgi:hypothetical protein